MATVALLCNGRIDNDLVVKAVGLLRKRPTALGKLSYLFLFFLVTVSTTVVFGCFLAAVIVMNWPVTALLGTFVVLTLLLFAIIKEFSVLMPGAFPVEFVWKDKREFAAPNFHGGRTVSLPSDH